jgi:hypothetical protein
MRATLPADHGNFVPEQKGHGRQGDAGRNLIAAEEVERHTCPAGTGSNQRPADIERSGPRREVRAQQVFQPEELPQGPDDDEKVNGDSGLRPTFPGHAEDCSAQATGRPGRGSDVFF